MELVQATKPQRITKEFTLALFLAGIFMGALDHGIVGPALSSIIADYGIQASWGVWSFSIYTLLFAVSIPLMGKLSDRLGRKRIFMTGITLFGLGSLLAALAPNFTMFLIGRSVQAIGTGGIFPITAAYIAVSYPEETRAKAMGWIGVIFGLGSILGPVAGGVIIDNFEWQWIFLINVPISAAIVLLMSRAQIQQNIVKKPIDYTGILTLTLLILSIMLGITLKNLWFAALGLVLIPLLVKVEKKSKDPVINIGYFTKYQTLLLLLLSLASGFIMASTINLLPSYIETKFELSKGAAAYGAAPLAVASMIASLVGGYLVTKLGAKTVLFIGFIVTGIGTFALTVTDIYPLFLAIVAVIGFGIGIIIGSPLNMMMIKAVQLAEAGSAVGFLSLFRSVGSTLGPTIAGIILTVSTIGFTYVSIVMGIVSLISIVLLMIKK